MNPISTQPNPDIDITFRPPDTAALDRWLLDFGQAMRDMGDRLLSSIEKRRASAEAPSPWLQVEYRDRFGALCPAYAACEARFRLINPAETNPTDSGWSNWLPLSPQGGRL